MTLDRRRFLHSLGGSAAGLALIRQAQALPATQRTGTLADVAHVVVLTQENRGFDHYFGALPGVRGFADPHPVPLPGGHTVWSQPRAKPAATGVPQSARLAPFRLDTLAQPRLMRSAGTPHRWPDAQQAWDHGRLAHWPAAKEDHSMGYFAPADIPLQTALADAFTLCDAYHCSFQGGTWPNRLFLFTGHNDPHGPGRRAGAVQRVRRLRQGRPEPGLHLDDLCPAPGSRGRELAGLPGRGRQLWRQPAGRLSHLSRCLPPAPGPCAAPARTCCHHARAGRAARRRAGRPPAPGELGGGTRGRQRTPVEIQPGPRRRLHGARDGRAAVQPRRVVAHRAAGQLRRKRRLLRPRTPARTTGRAAVARTTRPSAAWPATRWWTPRANTTSACHPNTPSPPNAAGCTTPTAWARACRMWAISPWSRGGWVCSEVFDHTSVLRFIEKRFGVAEPQISAWRRAVCGDLTRAFDFATPQATVCRPFVCPTPLPGALAAARLAETPVPPQPRTCRPRYSRRCAARAIRCPTPCRHGASTQPGARCALPWHNAGATAVVVHAYDRLQLQAAPRRYTLAAGSTWQDDWPPTAWVRYRPVAAGAQWLAPAHWQASCGAQVPRVRMRSAAAGSVNW
jgi:phospholipase C